MSDGKDISGLLDEVSAELGVEGGTSLDGEQMIGMMEQLLAERAHPEYETVMVPQEGPPRVHEGVDGFRKAMSDWLSPWEKFRFEFEEFVPVGDMIVMLVRQVGTTKHGGVEVETESAAVWWIVDERLRRAAFYLDRQAALEAAGLDPDRPTGG